MAATVIGDHVTEGIRMRFGAASGLLSLALLSHGGAAAVAQADPQPQRSTQRSSAYAFCSVTDTGVVPAKVWASSVVAVEHAADDPGGFARSQELAGEFYAVVRAHGGDGQKMCNVAATRGELDALRAENRALWDTRTFLVKAGDWRELAWTPAPWTPSVAAGGGVTRYFICHAVQTDLPDRSVLSRSVASGIFARQLPAASAAQDANALSGALAAAFQPVVAAQGLPAQAGCQPYDTRAEAEYAQQQLRQRLDGYNQKYTELAWEPTANELAAADVAAPADEARRPAAAIAATAAGAASSPPYCFALAGRSKPQTLVRTPIWQVASQRYGLAEQKAGLEQLQFHLSQAEPQAWYEFAAVQCFETGRTFPGETFCASVANEFFRGVQESLQVCNASREALERRRDDTFKARQTGPVRELAWPPSR